MSDLLYLSQNFSTTLNVPSGIDASQTTGIVLQSVTGLDTNGGILCLDWSATLDSNVAEYIEYGGIAGNELTGVTRGAEGVSAKTHSNGCTVVAVVSKSHLNRVNDKLSGTDTTALTDTNGNELLKTATTASAVNEVTIKNAETGEAPEIQATGEDTDIDLKLIPKGAGVLSVAGTTDYEDKVTTDDDIPNKKYVDDQVAGASGGGKVLQVVYGSGNTQTTINTGTLADINVSASITPTADDSKVLVLVALGDVASQAVDTAGDVALIRGSTNIHEPIKFAYRANDAGISGSEPEIFPGGAIHYLDSPATTLATTYKLQAKRSAGSGDLVFQKNSAISTIILMEIAA